MEDIIPRKEAQRQGLKHYFTGKPCKHGHIVYRNTKTSKCTECDRIHSEIFRREHPDVMQLWRKNNPLYASDNYHENKEQRKHQTKKWYNNNRERCLQKNKERYYDPLNQQKIKIFRNQWYKDHPEYDEIYRNKNKEKINSIWGPNSRTNFNKKQKAKIQQIFQELAQLHVLPKNPTERDFKYWLAGEIIKRTGWFVYKEIYLDNQHTSCIDLLIPEAKIGIELKLSNYNWVRSLVETQRARYQTLLQEQGYTVFVISLDGSLGISAQTFLENLPSIL